MDSNLDLSAKWGETTFSNYEVFMFGEALLLWLGTSIRVGHSSPGMTLDYTTMAPPSLGALFIRDVMAWTSHRKHLVEGCEERVRELLHNAEIDKHLAMSFDKQAGGAA